MILIEILYFWVLFALLCTVIMNQIINESIKVAGVFHHSIFKPVWFEWNNQQLKIDEITLISDYKQGSIKCKIYSILANGNLYRLHFDLNSHKWTVQSVWIDD